MPRSIRSILAICAITLLASACLAASALAGEGGENAAQALSRQTPPTRDLANPDNKALYCVGYAHLDTQWRWDFVTSIDEYVRSTLDDNFSLIEKYPDYVFSFTGSVRYEMMKEYYPERYERLKKYIADGRWFVSGSSVDEGDVNVPSPESIIRQVLYGNLFFKREFGKESADYMLPDCFGFPASMPSIWAHCGLLGFSTQKLTWGSAIGIPFPVGVWEGPNGESVLAALDPGPYVGAIKGPVGQNADWIARIKDNGEVYGVWADYHYYGTGDQGGAPKEEDVQNYVQSKAAEDRQMDILLVSSEELYHDITPELRERLPRYRGDMLLTEHSAGTLTSQSYMKRWNRKGEQLADAAERAAASSHWLGRMEYPRKKLERGWVRLLANQMHDILPGTSIPRAYRYSWNDDNIAMNQFAHVLTDAVANVAAVMDTQTTGTPLIVFNPLAIERTDTVEATVPLGGKPAVRVYGPEGNECPSQILSRQGGEAKVLFLATVPANAHAVFDVRPADKPFSDGKGPRITNRLIENESYRVAFNEAGDVESIMDLNANRPVLSRPASLVFTYEKPKNWPAWNMDWNDRKNPPIGTVDGPPQWRIVENGPVRVALAVTRKARNSEFTQIFRLTRDDPGKIVEVAAKIDWQSAECALKASFPLSVANPQATYNWGLGTITRENNAPKKYEVPSHEWFDVTDRKNEYGVSILEDSKFGSDKPSDDEVRLTLLYTPGVRGSFVDQHSQDWGIHDIRYGLFGHTGDWRTAQSEWRGRRFNQPLRAFVASRHPGPLGRSFSLAQSSTPQIDIRAIKLAEERDVLIVRAQELWGRPIENARLSFAAQIAQAEEVDGQERTLAVMKPEGDALSFDMKPYATRTFAVKLAAPRADLAKPDTCTPIPLEYDTDVASLDADRTDGAMTCDGRSYPGELLPAELTDNDVRFKLGTADAGKNQALTCRGQKIDLGAGKGEWIHILAAATEDVEDVPFVIGQTPLTLDIQAWTGFIAQWYDRVWTKKHDKVDFKGEGEVAAILPAFTKRDAIAWFSTHRHDPKAGNEAYRFAYIFHYVLPRPMDAKTLTLPYDERIRVFAVSVANDATAKPAAPLYDDLSGAKPIEIRHDYTVTSDPVFKGHAPIARVEISHAASFEALKIGPPQADDDVDAAKEAGFAFRVFAPEEKWHVHPASGAVEGRLVRLNDGQVAQNDDDTERCVWYDNEGRFTLDLQGERRINRIDTYSWHRSNRAPQYFSVWGSNSEEAPTPGFAAGQSTDWQLIAVVDSREEGDGGIHASRIANRVTPLGPYRHLLWICEDMGQGTFLTEIDIDFAE